MPMTSYYDVIKSLKYSPKIIVAYSSLLRRFILPIGVVIKRVNTDPSVVLITLAFFQTFSCELINCVNGSVVALLYMHPV